jgi:hypothetical protein
MTKLLALTAAVAAISLGLLACGSGKPNTTAGTSAAPSAVLPKAAFGGCPDSRETYEFGVDAVANAESEGGASARQQLHLGERMEREAVSNCKTERQLKSQEAKMCENTPQQLEEAFRLEETKANAEYIGVYEAICGKHVNVP